MAEIKITQLNDNQLVKMVDLKAESEKTNASKFSAYTSLRGGSACCLWQQC
jgi:hypothetical protein